MYCQLCDSVSRFQTEEVIEESMHENHTQIKKFLNNSVIRSCSKFKHVGTTMILTTRVNIFVCIYNTGFKAIYNKLFKELNIQ